MASSEPDWDSIRRRAAQHGDTHLSKSIDELSGWWICGVRGSVPKPRRLSGLEAWFLREHYQDGNDERILRGPFTSAKKATALWVERGWDKLGELEKLRAYGEFDPPKRVEMLRGSGTGYFKAGQFAYVLGWDARGGLYWVDRDGDSARGEMAYLVSKTKGMRGVALWFSASAVRFTARSSSSKS